MASQDPRHGPVETEPLQQGRPRSKVVGGRFVIDRLIARGGMGAVYLAHQLNLGRPVALKIMTPPPDGEDGDTFEERFRLEAETLAALHHQNIVTVYDYGPTEDGRYYLALEYIEGPRFTDLIRKGRMAPERAVRLMLQVCNGVRYAHKRGVVHRDLKPSNLLVRVEDGVESVKVVDFGLVKVAEADQSLTRAGLVLGSPHCMAPEQVRGEDIDHRADIYAIGILLFRSLTGTWPFHGETVAATMIAHVHEERPTFYSVAPDLMVPKGLEDIVQRCMARDSAERYADVGELIEALAGCLDIPEDQFLTVSSYHGSLSSRGPVDSDDPVRRNWVVPLVAAVLLLGVIAVLGVWRPWAGSATDATVGAGATTGVAATPAALETAPLAQPGAATGPDDLASAAQPSAGTADGLPGADTTGSAVAPPAARPPAAPTPASGSASGDATGGSAPSGSTSSGGAASGSISSGGAASGTPAAGNNPSAGSGAAATSGAVASDPPVGASQGSSRTDEGSPAENAADGEAPSDAPPAVDAETDGATGEAADEGDAPAGYMPLPDDF